MKFTWFDLMPWPHLPADFRQKHRSVWRHANACGLMPSPNLMAATLSRRASRAAVVDAIAALAG